MSLKHEPIGDIPELTARVARASLPKPSAAMVLRDELGTLFTDQDFRALYPVRGQPAQSPWRLMLVTVLQFLENLTDRQAAEAVRARIDWKYALGLELTDTGFDHTVLCEFRERLLQGKLEAFALNRLLERCRERKLLRAGGKQRTDSTHVLGAVRELNRLELLGETVRAALNELAEHAPGWLRQAAPPEWLERYAHRVEEYRLPHAQSKRDEYAQQVAEDGLALLQALEGHPDKPEGARLLALPRVRALSEVWEQQCQRTRKGIRVKRPKELPPGAARIESPYDPGARHSIKRETHWTGYKVHISESCDEDLPNLVTDVLTTPASTADVSATRPVLERLDARGLPPGEYLVDLGYVDAKLLVESEARGMDLIAPVRGGSSWQERAGDGAGAFTAEAFEIRWDERKVVCPQGKRSWQWNEAHTPSRDTIAVAFDPKDCGVCPVKSQCTRGTRRGLTLVPRAIFEAREVARERVKTEEFKRRYHLRAGIEGTVSQGTRAFGLRRARYRDEGKVGLQHLLVGAAMNVARLVRWWGQDHDRPVKFSPRRSAFERLMRAA